MLLIDVNILSKILLSILATLEIILNYEVFTKILSILVLNDNFLFITIPLWSDKCIPWKCWSWQWFYTFELYRVESSRQLKDLPDSPNGALIKWLHSLSKFTTTYVTRFKIFESTLFLSYYCMRNWCLVLFCECYDKKVRGVLWRTEVRRFFYIK